MSAILEATGLCKNFGALAVVKDVSLSLERGARRALIGPNGAGKTTLIGLLSGVISTSAGRIVLAGEDVTDLAPHRRVKRGLGRTFQVNNLFQSLTVLENVLLAISEHRGASRRMVTPMSRERALLDEARTILAELGLKQCSEVRVSELSYGRQRLVEIAIALSLRPKVLLLDEPAAGIPASDAAELINALKRLPADMAILLIDHDMQVVRQFAQNVTVLVGGSILMSGVTEAILASEEVRQVYLGRDRQPHGSSAVSAAMSHGS
jgi:ABC-type branched-subunit amino acid transport system ATPase component